VGTPAAELGVYTRSEGNRAQWLVVSINVMRRIRFISVLFAAAMAAAYTDYSSARQKIDTIESGRLRPGARVQLTYPEITAWAAHEAPAGVRNPQIRVTSPGIATGTALIDFLKVRRAQGQAPGWLMSKFLDGERPVSVTARFTSGAGRATVDVQRVEISGIAIDGRTLEFLIQNILLPMYPNAAIGRPFELGDRIERFDVQPGGVAVHIGK
jgi:hypothetical protein